MVLNLIRKLQKGLLVMKELIQFIAHELVDYPEKVTVHEVIGNSTAVLELKPCLPIVALTGESPVGILPRLTGSGISHALFKRKIRWPRFT